MISVDQIKKDFPVFTRKVNGHDLCYLDNAASSQRPKHVIDSLVDYYSFHNANVHRGLHTLSEEATQMYEDSRVGIAHFIGASSHDEIIFTKGATESLNRVAFSWGLSNLASENIILTTDFEHHSNLIPWQVVCKRVGAKLMFLESDENGDVGLDKFKSAFAQHGSKIKLVAVTHASNVLGTILNIKEISKIAHEYGAVVSVDGAQAIPHLPVNVQSLGCDFYSFSGHKMLGPMGIGVLWGRKTLLENLEPYEYGGGMIDMVSYENATFAPLPEKLEAGTPPVSGAVGLKAAIDYLSGIGMDAIREHEVALSDYALKKLSDIPDIKVLGPKQAEKRTGLVTFTLGDIHAHDVASVMSGLGIAVRSGHHCTMPYHRKHNIAASTRASYYLYNSIEDIDTLVKGVHETLRILK